MRRILWCTFLGALMCSAAFGQNASGRFHGAAFGNLGWSGTMMTNDVFPNVLSDSEASFGGGVEIRPFSHFGAEFAVNRMPRNEKPNGVALTSKGSAVFVTGSGVFRFIPGRFQPYFVLGLGTFVHKEELASPLGTTITRLTNIGGGAEISVLPRLYVRSEVRLLMPRNIFSKVMRVSTGLAYHW